MTERFKAKLKAINAVAVLYDTGEKWVDENGTKYNIERKPIDWGKNAKPMYTVKGGNEI